MAEFLNTDIDSTINSNTINSAEFYRQLRHHEQQWWLSRQRLIVLKERQIFWFGEKSLMMWLLWQLVSYVVIAMIVMLLSKLSMLHLSLWQYISIFALQTLIFIVMLGLKGHLAQKIYRDIHKEELAVEQTLNEMTILATDSFFDKVHRHSPLSLQRIHQQYASHLHLISLHHLLQQEVNKGRLALSQHAKNTAVLPVNLADDELAIFADNIFYKSLI